MVHVDFGVGAAWSGALHTGASPAVGCQSAGLFY